MRTRHLGCIAVVMACCVPTAVMAGCQLQQIGTMPVDMRGLVPIISTKINGADVRFMLDTGDFYSLMWRNAATRYQLPITDIRGGPVYIQGAGGVSEAQEVTAKSFEFLGVHVSNAKFLLLNGWSEDPAGLIGQNLLRISDVEFDLANGVVRFFKPVDCEGKPLAYWAVSTPYTSVDMHSMDSADNHLGATAIVDGRRMSVWFDTGSSRSFLSLDAAARIGVTPTSPGVTLVGLDGGIGGGTFKTWSAPVDSFQLGGEKVGHAQLLIADLQPQRRGYLSVKTTPDMILGADFFLSHRIYVAYSQKKIYFTYNGGPLFNLNLPQVISGKAPPPATLDANGHAVTADVPTDADGFRRQGRAYASMRDFDHALADLTRACQLAPNDATNYYDRGVIYRQDRQFKSALEDFSSAIKLQPDDLDAHLARALLLQSQPDADPAATSADIKSDLDAVGRLAPAASSVRLTLDDAYDKLGDYPDALDQIDQWLNTHPLRNDQAAGFNNRCWLRATSNRDLNEALADCGHALDLTRDDPDTFDSRGLVYLRLGRPGDAIIDYGEALDANPNMPTALYGRGLAELRMGAAAQGQKDLAAAAKLDSGIAKRFASMGLSP